ncbi:restriction endonuclease subunit S [Streptomyces althioticus]
MTWESVPFLEAAQDVSSGNAKVPKSEYLPSGILAVVDQGKDLIAGFTDDVGLAHRSTSPVIVFGDHTRAVKFVDFPFAMGADGVKVLSPRQGFDPKYLYRFLSSVNIPSAGYSRHFKFLKDITVVKPPLREQRRIASVLDQVDILRAKRRKAIALLEDLAQSMFLNMFGESTCSTEWPRMLISDIGEVVTGSTPETSNASYFDGPIPFATPAEIGREWLVRNTSRTLTNAGAARGRLVPAGSVLVTCIGASLGNVSLAEVPLATNQQINSVVLNSSIIDSWYALFAFRKLLPDLWSASSSTTLPIVSKRKFQSLHIPVPGISEQRKFGSVMNRLKQEMAPHHNQISALDELLVVLQQRGFSGTLWDHEATA